MRERWPAAVRERASELLLLDGLSVPEIAETLRAELSADVPLQTIRGWSIADRRRRPPVDVSAAIDGLSARTVALLDRELAALERGRGRLDLARIERVARSLSVLRRTPARDGQTPRSNGHRTLADLETGKGESGDVDV